jgi:hypothetical protein
MPKYTVTIYENLAHTTIVHAENRDEALQSAYDVVMNEAGEYDTESLGSTGEPDVEEIGE